MQEGPDPVRLKDLEKRIEALKKSGKPEPRVVKDFGAADLGWRMVIELVSGLGIGAAIGYGLDRLLGTLPWALVVFTLLGFAAGVRVMMRTAGEFQKRNMERNAGGDARTEGEKDGSRD
ncbi:AtpZ/AtpI family protein [Frigidibacter sp. RF13]|uniref:AtpZ/AtpI family protein n=1 Tax=Frigidibacter sp. RF13 TaxID=2997340 RepID=UPI002270FF55|nr:AtpZ/AtpI family protein [Frigidibacter sp. RF13]MCY1126824.1 AtpZ/AtpI family protein [Frigidibacter sp. RF13]